MHTEIFFACDQIVTAAVNSIGEGMLLAILVGWSLRALGQTNAATRHVVWFGALLMLVGLGPAQWWRQRAALASGALLVNPSEAPATSRPGDMPGSAAEPKTELMLTEVEPFVPRDPAGNADGSIAPAAASASQLQLESRRPWARYLNPASWGVRVRATLPRAASALLVMLWIIGAAVKMVLLLCRLNRLRKEKQRFLPPGPELDELFQKVREKLGVRRQVELKMSAAHRSAVVLGFVRPVVLFPLEEGQPVDLQAAEQVLAHELAHVQRLDDWANLTQRLIEATLFFHPVVWWVSKRIALEREVACDDFVLEQGGRPQTYALLLVHLAGRRNGSQPLLAPGVSAGKRQLQQRIGMILNAHRNTSPRLAKTKLGFISAGAGLVALLMLYVGPKLVLAQNTPAPANANRADASSSSAATPGSSGVSVVLAEPVPVTAAPSDVDQGPTFKKGQPEDDDSFNSATRPRQPRKPRPPRVPGEPMAESNIEERLDRLERMVKSLMAEQSSRPARVDVPESNSGDRKAFTFGKENELRADAAKREASRAAEIDKRAMKQAERAAKMEEKWREKAPLPDKMQAELQALRQQREVLQREMEKLQTQIERIAREHERLEQTPRTESEEQSERKEP